MDPDDAKTQHQMETASILNIKEPPHQNPKNEIGRKMENKPKSIKPPAQKAKKMLRNKRLSLPENLN